ncbi:MAG: integrase arm-type DNA-binding domain-containing protein, partial [Gammaproteobacteria bacterium]|nr:integrase arm-type DNA-binding domain-containing protein [Gammaproteobacteria bacterium]
MPEKLSAAFVKKNRQPGKYPDGGNLYLQVSKNRRKDGSTSITKSWLFRYSRFSKDTWLGLGPYPDVTLAEARELATDERRKLRRGIDPYTDKLARRRALRSEDTLTFAECATRYVDAHAAGWSNPKHIAQWRSTLQNIAGPVIGHLPVNRIETAHVLCCLEEQWASKTETMSRLRGRIENVLDWATVRGYRKGDNPARWRGHLDKLLPKPSKVAPIRHHAALPYAEVGAFMKSLRAHNGSGVRALEFTILTATRTIEVIGAIWSEFDLDAKTWTIPSERMKAKREHRVPLSPAALAVLKQQRGHDDVFVFPGSKPGTPLSNAAMMQVMKRLGFGDHTVHGFRS